ncbi:9076_t:CDS:2, partial [Ambispora leptoticha]
ENNFALCNTETKPTDKTALYIGRTGNGKSTLANVLVNKNREFEEIFKEGHGSTSETREIREKTFETNGIEYCIIDTPGIGDTKVSEIDVVNEIVKVHDKVKDGLSQILFVISKKFTKEEEEVHNILSYVIFNSEISKYTTIVRTGFSGFRNVEKCEEDKKKIEKENPSLAKLIKSCKKIIYVDNQPLTDDYEKDEITINKSKREKSRQKLLEHLETCKKIYKPDNIEIIQERISDHYMEEKEKYKDYGLCSECNQSNTGSAYGIDDYDGVVKCHGVSQDPETNDYIMVMDYIEGGNLRKYLSVSKLNFRDKLWQLRHVAKGLKSIHYKKLIHRDLHAGNILISNNNVCLITDLGLCRPVDEKDDEAEEFNKKLADTVTIGKRKDSESHLNLDPLYYHPNAFYTSRLLDFKNLPEPQNSKEINYEFYSRVLSIDFAELNIKDNEIPKRLRSMSMEEAYQKETKSVKLDKIAEKKEFKSEPTEIDDNTQN